MDKENVFYEVLNGSLFKRTVKVYPDHKVQTKERVGDLSAEMDFKMGDVFLSQNETRYLQIVEKNQDDAMLAYRVYEPNTLPRGFISKRVSTTPGKFRDDLLHNRFGL